MTWPVPQPGLVVRYSYLWHHEALAGREEGIKDRPCAVILAVQAEKGGTRVYVLPITHRAPAAQDAAIEIPPTVKARLRLDTDRCWLVLSEANAFDWPGPDLRPLPGQGAETAAYGFLPPGFFRIARDRFLEVVRGKKAAVVSRTV
jgi:hypothetical protein